MARAAAFAEACPANCNPKRSTRSASLCSGSRGARTAVVTRTSVSVAPRNVATRGNAGYRHAHSRPSRLDALLESRVGRPGQPCSWHSLSPRAALRLLGAIGGSELEFTQNSRDVRLSCQEPGVAPLLPASGQVGHWRRGIAYRGVLDDRRGTFCSIAR